MTGMVGTSSFSRGKGLLAKQFRSKKQVPQVPTFMLKMDSAKPPKIDRALGNSSFPASTPTRNPATYSTCTARSGGEQ